MDVVFNGRDLGLLELECTKWAHDQNRHWKIPFLDEKTAVIAGSFHAKIMPLNIRLHQVLLEDGTETARPDGDGANATGVQSRIHGRCREVRSDRPGHAVGVE